MSLNLLDELADAGRRDYTEGRALHFISSAPRTFCPPALKDETALSLSFFTAGPHTSLEAESGIRNFLVIFSLRSVFLQERLGGSVG